MKRQKWNEWKSHSVKKCRKIVLLLLRWATTSNMYPIFSRTDDSLETPHLSSSCGSHMCLTTLTFAPPQWVDSCPPLACRCWASAHRAARPPSWFSRTIWGDAWIYFWPSDFPQAQQLHLLCAIQYKSNRVLGTVQLRDYSDYVIVLFGKYSRVRLQPFDKGPLAAARHAGRKVSGAGGQSDARTNNKEEIPGWQSGCRAIFDQWPLEVSHCSPEWNSHK